MGAMASKKARASAPVSARMLSASAPEVRGPVAMIQCPSVGSSVTSPSTTEISGWLRSRAVTASAKGSRSTASAPPAGRRWARAISMINPPAAPISQCKRPTALRSSSSERKEFEQTISAKEPVRCAKVPTCGRISCSTTGTPASAACHAASDPAMPPPRMWSVCVMAGSYPARQANAIAQNAPAPPVTGQVQSRAIRSRRSGSG